MLSLPPTVRVFIALAPIDMRGSFDALAGAVRRLGLDPADGHLYLPMNKAAQTDEGCVVRWVGADGGSTAFRVRELILA